MQTYTSHGSIKRGNRKSEILLREVRATCRDRYMPKLTDPGGVLCNHGISFWRLNVQVPQRGSQWLMCNANQLTMQRLDAAWEDLLLCQFHDVLPGSGIAMVSRCGWRC
jgi:alpha-mannosidase